MTITDIIEACENVTLNDIVTVVIKNIDSTSGDCIKKELRFRRALYWLVHDISEPADHITFKVMNNSNTLIITVLRYSSKKS